MENYSKFDPNQETRVAEVVNGGKRFVPPARSLYTKTNPVSLKQATVIVDENEQVVYQARSKAVSLSDKTYIQDAEGNDIAHLRCRIFSGHKTHVVTMADGLEFQTYFKSIHMIKDVINIRELGWQLRGNPLRLIFEIYDSDGEIIANIRKKLVSVSNRYCIDIYRQEYEKTVIAVFVTLQHFIRNQADLVFLPDGPHLHVRVRI